MKIVFVLVEPAVPENIGAAARAIKTMGFSELRLVNPTPDFLGEKAKTLAHGARDILENAMLFPSLHDALADIDFSIGTTAKNRSVKADYHLPERARNILTSKAGMLRSAAIVFGREESGLTNDELRLCDIASTIPLSNPYPSINLAQSAMIFAYVFSELNNLKPDENDMHKEDHAYLHLKNLATDLFRKTGIDKNENLYHRMLERLATAGADDIHLFLSFAVKINELLERRKHS